MNATGLQIELGSLQKSPTFHAFEVVGKVTHPRLAHLDAGMNDRTARDVPRIAFVGWKGLRHPFAVDQFETGEDWQVF
jgi:hypothetical protein